MTARVGIASSKLAAHIAAEQAEPATVVPTGEESALPRASAAQPPAGRGAGPGPARALGHPLDRAVRAAARQRHRQPARRGGPGAPPAGPRLRLASAHTAQARGDIRRGDGPRTAVDLARALPLRSARAALDRMCDRMARQRQPALPAPRDVSPVSEPDGGARAQHRPTDPDTRRQDAPSRSESSSTSRRTLQAGQEKEDTSAFRSSSWGTRKPGFAASPSGARVTTSCRSTSR